MTCDQKMILQLLMIFFTEKWKVRECEITWMKVFPPIHIFSEAFDSGVHLHLIF